MLNYQRVGQLPGVLLHFLRNLYQHSISPCSVAWLAWWFTHNGRFLNYGYPKPLVFQFIKKSSDLDDNLGYPHLRKCVCMYVYIYISIYLWILNRGFSNCQVKLSELRIWCSWSMMFDVALWGSHWRSTQRHLLVDRRVRLSEFEGPLGSRSGHAKYYARCLILYT